MGRVGDFREGGYLRSRCPIARSTAAQRQARCDGRVWHAQMMAWTDLDDQDEFKVEKAEQERLSSVPVLEQKVRHDNQRQQE